jgi:hypothetical protein
MTRIAQHVLLRANRTGNWLLLRNMHLGQSEYRSMRLRPRPSNAFTEGPNVELSGAKRQAVQW